MIFRISLERNFRVTDGAFEVESKDFNIEICFFVTNLHSHVKLCTNV
jgi:hypothetical protein